MLKHDSLLCLVQTRQAGKEEEDEKVVERGERKKDFNVRPMGHRHCNVVFIP